MSKTVNLDDLFRRHSEGQLLDMREACYLAGARSLQSMVRDFNVAVATPRGETPALRAADLRANLIEEEAAETVSAIRSGDLVAAVDGLCDLLYVVLGAADAFGVELGPFFAEVHATNMAKIGGPRRDDGKVLKPEGWRPPRIREMLAALGYVAVPEGSREESTCSECGGPLVAGGECLRCRAIEDLDGRG